MLKLKMKPKELWDEETSTFIITPARTLRLEHSLLSVSKWESKWKKPFLQEKTEKTIEELRDYVRCMTIDRDVDEEVYRELTLEDFQVVHEYIEDSMTATWFNDKKRRPNREIVTSEVIYYQMTALNIPFECDKWHLNRLLTLIKVCSIHNGPQEQMTRRDLMNQNKALNQARKQKYRTRG